MKNMNHLNKVALLGLISMVLLPGDAFAGRIRDFFAKWRMPVTARVVEEAPVTASYDLDIPFVIGASDIAQEPANAVEQAAEKTQDVVTTVASSDVISIDAVARTGGILECVKALHPVLTVAAVLGVTYFAYICYRNWRKNPQRSLPQAQ